MAAHFPPAERPSCVVSVPVTAAMPVSKVVRPVEMAFTDWPMKGRLTRPARRGLRGFDWALLVVETAVRFRAGDLVLTYNV